MNVIIVVQRRIHDNEVGSRSIAVMSGATRRWLANLKFDLQKR